MQNKSPAKTASAPKNRIFLSVGMFFSVLFFALLPSILAKPFIDVQLGSNHYQLEVVENEDDKKRGLSGRSNIRDDQGMIFIYAEQDRRCMWMKDMNFSIDIIWLDENEVISHIEANVTPETYPNSFCGETDAKYVIELKGGVADSNGVRVGDNVDIVP